MSTEPSATPKYVPCSHCGMGWMRAPADPVPAMAQAAREAGDSEWSNPNAHGLPEWVVNNYAELGVRVAGKFFWLYKGHSLVYTSGKKDNGEPMRWRRVGKREFGECCHPAHLDDLTESYGEGEGWQDLPPQDDPHAPKATDTVRPAPEQGGPKACCEVGAATLRASLIAEHDWTAADEAQYMESAKPAAPAETADDAGVEAEALKAYTGSDPLTLMTLQYNVVCAQREHLRRDLCDIAEGCGVGVPDQAKAKRRIIAIRGERDAAQLALAACHQEVMATRMERDEAVARVEDLQHEVTGRIDEIVALNAELAALRKPITLPRIHAAGEYASITEVMSANLVISALVAHGLAVEGA